MYVLAFAEKMHCEGWVVNYRLEFNLYLNNKNKKNNDVVLLLYVIHTQDNGCFNAPQVDLQCLFKSVQYD